MTDALDGDRIAESVNPALRSSLRRVTVLPEVDSTNTAVQRLPAGDRHGHAILAECQTVGRGRRQRRWHSPAGGNIYMSLGWRFGREAPVLSNLPLLAALCVASAVTAAVGVARGRAALPFAPGLVAGAATAFIVSFLTDWFPS